MIGFCLPVQKYDFQIGVSHQRGEIFLIGKKHWNRQLSDFTKIMFSSFQNFRTKEMIALSKFRTKIYKCFQKLRNLAATKSCSKIL